MWTFDCVKTEMKTWKLYILYNSALGLFNYHLNVKCKYLYQYLINFQILISIQRIVNASENGNENLWVPILLLPM